MLLLCQIGTQLADHLEMKNDKTNNDIKGQKEENNFASRITFEETFHLVENNILELLIQGWCIRSCLSIDQEDWESGVGSRCRRWTQPLRINELI